METLTIDLKKKKLFEIGQQGDHNALCIHFINMKNVGTNKKYIYYTIDGIENCVPLTNDRFIIGYPLTAHSGIASAQLISKLNDNSIIKLSNVFAMHIKESKGYKDSGEYPVDPNIQSSYDLLDDLIDQTQDLINNYNYATLMEKLTQASSEATTSATTAKKCADELKSSTDFINTLDDKVAAQDSKIEKIEASTSHITTKQNTKIAALQTRMSEFTSLKDGSTTGDAELIDARIGADGTKYSSVGDAMRGQVEQLNEDLTHYIYKPTLVDNNKFPRAKEGNVEWVEQGLPTDEQTANAINNWLDAHPDATTTVQDGVITEIKINDSFLPYIKKDYLTPEMFGAKGDGSTDDTSALQRTINKSVETKKDIVLQNKTYLTTQPLQIQEKITMRGISYADEYYGQACIKNDLTNIFTSETNELEGGIKLLNIRFIGTQNFIANATFNWSQIRHCGFVGFSKVFENVNFLGCWLTDLFINNIKALGNLGGSDNTFENWFINGHMATQDNNEPLVTLYGIGLSRFTNIYCTGVEVGEQNTYGSNTVLFIDGYTNNLVFDRCWFDYANDTLIKIKGRGNDVPNSIANNITFNQCCIRGGCLKTKSSFIDADLCSGITFNQCFFDKHHAGVHSVEGYTIFNIGNTLVHGFFNNNNTYMIPRTISGAKNKISELFTATNNTNPKTINTGFGLSGITQNNVNLQNTNIEYRIEEVTTDSQYGSFTIYFGSQAKDGIIFAQPIVNNAVCCVNSRTDNSATFILRDVQSGGALVSKTIKVMLFIIYFKDNNWGN